MLISKLEPDFLIDYECQTHSKHPRKIKSIVYSGVLAIFKYKVISLFAFQTGAWFSKSLKNISQHIFGLILGGLPVLDL